MNTNPNATRILCFGDSNTWGDDPRFGAPRYPADIRWTGQLQKNLGNDYEIIEEGLCGRTTVVDDPKEEGRNGKTYLKPCLLTHNPLDIVILMLGTNDLKERFNLSPKDIAGNIEILIKIIQENGIDRKQKPSRVILLSPTVVNESIFNFAQLMQGMRGAGEKSTQLAKQYEEVAKRYGCVFINLAEYIQPSKIDGCHLDEGSHTVIAEVLSAAVESLTK